MVTTSRRIVTVVMWALLLLPGVAAARQDDLSVVANTYTFLKNLQIEWQEFKQLYDANRVVVVDLRPADSFAAGHIPGARSVPLEDIRKQAQALNKLHKPIVLYSAGPGDHRSDRAVITLSQQNVKVHVLVGGFRKWFQETSGKVERQ